MLSNNPENQSLPLSIDNFRVHELIGQGSQAKVYLCSSPSMNELVSIKVYNSVDLYYAYERQVSILKQTSHPNIIRLISYNPQAIIKYSHGQQQTKQIIVLQYAYHGQLLSIVNLQRAFQQKTCKYIFSKIVSILQYLQNCSIAHRDIKLQNILVDINYQIKLIDFGLATPLSTIVDNLEICQHFQVGYYKPPEIYKTQYNCQKFDIFSAGFVLFYLLFDRVPFRSSKYSCKQYSYIRNHNSEAFWKYHSNNNTQASQLFTNSSLKSFIFKLFHPNPEQRPSYEQILRDQWLTTEIANEQQAIQQIKQKIVTLNNRCVQRKNFYLNIERLTEDLKIQDNCISQYKGSTNQVNPQQ